MKLNSLQTTLSFIIFLIWFSQTTIINAQEEKIDPALTLAPAIFELDVNPSQTLQESISIINETEFAMPIKIEISHYSLDEFGIPDFSEDNPIWNPEEWISFKNTDIILIPKEKRNLSLQFIIPDNIQAGSYFAVLFFKPVLPPEYFESYSAHVIPYIGAIVNLNVIDPDLETMTGYIEIEDFSAKENIEFSSTIKNKDIYYHKINGEIKISNFFKRNIGTMPINDITLFPNKARIINNPYQNKLLWGKYYAHLTVEDENIYQDETITFWILPPLWTVLLPIPIFFIIYIIIFKRKNLKKAIKIFTHGELIK